ncbi:MAG: hypothetical protein EAX96_04500 [Candidatus Lokiarchaeota archaeon]|nr:hypothetical protein [Candidatus Lokiarchaeota archaeon]
MGLKETLIKKKNDLYDFLTNPKVAKWSIIGIFVIFIPSIIIGVFVAQLHGPYNIISNYISDLGSFDYTPIPKFLDDACMLTAIFLIPSTLYIAKVVTQKTGDSGEKGRIVLGRIAEILMFIGIIGVFSLGFVSEDVGFYLKQAGASPVDLHTIFTIFFFPFLAFSGIFTGLICIIYSENVQTLFNINVPKALVIILGLEMVILPQVFCTIFLVNLISPIVIIPPSTPFYEWMFLISLLTWLVALALITLRHINKELDVNIK